MRLINAHGVHLPSLSPSSCTSISGSSSDSESSPRSSVCSLSPITNGLSLAVCFHPTPFLSFRSLIHHWKWPLTLARMKFPAWSKASCVTVPMFNSSTQSLEHTASAFSSLLKALQFIPRSLSAKLTCTSNNQPSFQITKLSCSLTALDTSVQKDWRSVSIWTPLLSGVIPKLT